MPFYSAPRTTWNTCGSRAPQVERLAGVEAQVSEGYTDRVTRAQDAAERAERAMHAPAPATLPKMQLLSQHCSPAESTEG